MDTNKNQMDNLIEKIKNANTFDEIAEIKDFIYRASVAGGIDIEEVLAGLYKSPTRFIFELLQNAEDAGATKVSITLEKDKFEFCHDGRPFTLRDIKGITGVNNSEKAEDLTKIGAFGIGFKSVFGVCTAPEIYSDEYNFRIRNCYVPEKILTPHSSQQKGMTYIVLPFKEDLCESLYDDVEETLKNLPPETMLFLRNIIQIDYLTIGHCGFYRREKERKEVQGIEYHICTIKGDQGARYYYYLFEEPCNVNEKFNISIAYRFNHASKKITKDTESNKVVVFFPTEEETFLSFLINGPYQTTKTRESIPETKDNLEVLDQTVELYKKSILCFKALNLLTTTFIESLPLISRKKTNYLGIEIKTSINLFYESFCKATRLMFSEHELLPTADGGFCKINEAILARGPVVDLLSEDDNEVVFGRRKWLSTEITKDKTEKLVSFLQFSKVKEVDFEVLLTSLPKSFFEAKPIEWFIKFYSRGNRNIDTIKKHLNKEFILTESGKVVAPYLRVKQNDHKNVYLPSKLIKDAEKIVNKTLMLNSESRSFFDNIGIEEMDITESIRTQWLPTIESSKDENEHFENFYLLYLEMESQTPNIKEQIKQLVRSSECILFKDSSLKTSFEKPSAFFMSHGASKTLYDGNENLLFIYPALDNEAKKDKKFFDFLVSLGVNPTISFVQKTTGLTWMECEKIMSNANYSRYSYFAYDIRELEYILQNLTEERAKILFEILNSTDEEYFEGELQWKYYNNITKKSFPSFFVKRLQNEKWILNREGEFVSPQEIYEDEVKSLYGGGKILKYFSFKPDIIKQLPPEEQQILEITRGLPFEFLQQMREQYLQLTMPKPIDIDPENAPVNINDIDFSNSYEDLSSEELTYMEDFSDIENTDISEALDLLYGNSDIPDEIVEKIIVRRSSNEAELDGDLGERFVISSLKKKYSDEGYKIYNEENNSFSAKKDDIILSVMRHNTTSKKQKGYDITISKNGDVLEYIEVKSKKTDDKEFFTVSGLQWEFAKKLYQEGNGGKHFVYVVSNVRSENKTKISKVSNPYKAWIEGCLDADPVRIKY